MKLVVGKHKQQWHRFRVGRQRSHMSQRRMEEAMSSPGKATERDASKFVGTVEVWRSTPRLPEHKMPLGRRLDELRRRIVESGEPLLSSWEEVDRELGERRSKHNG